MKDYILGKQLYSVENGLGPCLKDFPSGVTPAILASELDLKWKKNHSSSVEDKPVEFTIRKTSFLQNTKICKYLDFIT
ncbi:hypothetical protein O9G_003316 [Rozella allomycis CSF55]|uniref:Cell division control protein 24 OB domain-containing protein n=1 Tax=Rozella allomycis (strain CSF55) TaxID=988480 RepID=A0A075B239_ROZAC|nr:hypothetical protein O9G_003316 [Rozella allomycis CSF55]|eukprot:EPZ36445.1 hypothetical protein O9G_003316 [Rozella allomycis CSF55]